MQPMKKRQLCSKANFFSKFNGILSLLIAVTVVSAVCTLINLPQISAFFTDKIYGSGMFNASSLKVEVSDIKAQRILYSGAVNKQKGDDELTGLYADMEEVSTTDVNNYYLLSDGYILPFEFKMMNTSRVVEDLVPQVSLSWEGLKIDGTLYLYPGTLPDDEIFDDESRSKAITKIDPQNGFWTDEDSTIRLKPGQTTEKPVGYKIYFLRSSVDDNRVNYSSYRKQLTINVGAKAFFADDVAPNWSAVSNDKNFKVLTQVFSKPYVARVAGATSLSSDNNSEVDNAITVSYDNESGNLTAMFSVFPKKYEIGRYEAPSIPHESPPPSIKDSEKTLTITRTATQNKGELTDTAIPWMKRVAYKITSLDDYGREISFYNNNSDTADEGLIYMPDRILRNLCKPLCYNKVDLDERVPITLKNFTIYQAMYFAEKGIAKLDGLQYLKGYIGELMLSYNTGITTIKGKLPDNPETTVLQLSLKGLKIPESELSEIGVISAKVTHLYLWDMDLKSIKPLTDLDMPKLKLIGLENNFLTRDTGVSDLEKFQTLEHIDLIGNETLTDVVGLFDYIALPNLTYFNLNGCKLSDASKEYLADRSNFYERCEYTYGYTTYTGSRPIPTS